MVPKSYLYYYSRPIQKSLLSIFIPTFLPMSFYQFFQISTLEPLLVLLFLCKILTASFILILPPEAACLSHFFLQLLHLQIYYSLFNQPTHWQTSGLFPDFYNYKPCFSKESSVNITSDCDSIFGVVFPIWYCRLQG